MKMPQIRMESTMARIRIEQVPGKIDMKQHHAKQTIEQPKANLTMRTTKGKMHIDQSQAWEDRNLMSTRRLNELHAQRGLQLLQEGVERRAEQGAQLIKIEENRNIFADQAIENGAKPLKTPTITYIPSPFSVKMNYERGDLQIDVETREPIIEVETYRPDIDFHRGIVQIEVEQHADLQIDYINLYV